MKLPKSVPLCGRHFEVRKETAPVGMRGTFDTEKQQIIIDNAIPDDLVVDTFRHEVFEGAAVLLGIRYESAEDCIFVMNHRQFNNLISATNQPILDLIRLNRRK